jgi:hypothetical protein
MEKRWAGPLARGNAPLRFGPAEGGAFFAPFGRKEAEFRSVWEESARLRRWMPFGWFWHWMTRFASRQRRETVRRFSSIVLLERSGR